MRRKNEEELIKLAFGDIEETSSERTRRLLDEDASAAKLFSSYAEMREGLKQLKAPEHQLSTERLRERILAEGLKKEKASPLGWRWSLAPIAVAATAMLITLRLNSGSDPQIPVGYVANPDLGASSASENAIDWSPRMDSILSGSYEGGAVSTDLAVPDVPVRAPSREARVAPASTNLESRSGMRLASRGSEGREKVVVPLTPAEISNLAIDGALPAAASSEASSEPIVLIGADSDEFTGANRATEVSSASNVVVGG